MATRRAPDFALPDVTGRPVTLGDFRGAPVVLIFGGRDSREEVRVIARAIGLSRGAAAPPLVLIVDLRGVPGFLHGMVRGALRGVHEEAVRESAQILRALGAPPPPIPPPCSSSSPTGTVRSLPPSVLPASTAGPSPFSSTATASFAARRSAQKPGR